MTKRARKSPPAGEPPSSPPALSPLGVHIPSPWSEAADSITYDSPVLRPPVTVICGPKNSGKSTFSRHLVNALLRRYTRVAYLDTDVGQPEFTPPGCLSLHICPSRLSRRRCLFFGDISSKRDPKAYADSVFQLFDFYKEYRPSKLANPGEPMLPLVVNTPGWVKGIGYDLLVHMLTYMEPTHVIQMRISSEHKNLPTGVFWSDVSQNEAVNLIYLHPADTDFSNQFCSMPACCRVLIRKQAHYLRDIRLIAYFQQCVPSDLNISTHKELAHALASIPPYEVAISGVKILHLHCQVPRSEIFHSLNATIVGLTVSSGESTDPVRHTPWCVGLGIVRGIDISTDLLYVITPVPLCHLEKVDLLLQGFIEIPKCLLQISKIVEFVLHIL
ncbi:hypothetical protein Taro_027895 [Colocasia esculenta]|uniref:Polynucleotide 5'-hydroxyl-kinase NOL9 n=1 Tax=Colocasia esculenta TaxID=4460 RepID=A0A843VSQ7_COLES|nr:hypothetical protein [Colocasia esculenta]